MIEEELIILTKNTVDVFLKQENPAELIALYSFYYYTAKWQKTNVAKCTTDYTARVLKWSGAKVRKIKKQLIELGLIEDTVSKDESGHISGHYIKLNYIFKKSTLKEIHTHENPQGGNDYTMEENETNALNADNSNALNADKKMLKVNNKETYAKEIEEIITYFNEKTGKNYRLNNKTNSDLIIARLKDGFTVEDFKTVIDNKVEEWLNDSKMNKYLTPTTLFRASHFEDYLNSKPKKKEVKRWGGLYV